MSKRKKQPTSSSIRNPAARLQAALEVLRTAAVPRDLGEPQRRSAEWLLPASLTVPYQEGLPTLVPVAILPLRDWDLVLQRSPATAKRFVANRVDVPLLREDVVFVFKQADVYTDVALRDGVYELQALGSETWCVRIHDDVNLVWSWLDSLSRRDADLKRIRESLLVLSPELRQVIRLDSLPPQSGIYYVKNRRATYLCELQGFVRLARGLLT